MGSGKGGFHRIQQTFRKLSTLVQFFVSDDTITIDSQWLERVLQRMILDISERKVDNAALVVFHQLVEALDQVSLGGLIFRLAISVLQIRLSAGLTSLGPLDLTNPLGLMPDILEHRAEQSQASS